MCLETRRSSKEIAIFPPGFIKRHDKSSVHSRTLHVDIPRVQTTSSGFTANENHKQRHGITYRSISSIPCFARCTSCPCREESVALEFEEAARLYTSQYYSRLGYVLDLALKLERRTYTLERSRRDEIKSSRSRKGGSKLSTSCHLLGHPLVVRLSQFRPHPTMLLHLDLGRKVPPADGYGNERMTHNGLSWSLSLTCMPYAKLHPVQSYSYQNQQSLSQNRGGMMVGCQQEGGWHPVARTPAFLAYSSVSL